MRGRKPSARGAKLAKGETRPSRVNYQEPVLPPPDSLEPPADLKGAGRLLWLTHLKAMVDAGKVRSDHMPAFLRHCRTESEIEHWERQFKAAVRMRDLDRQLKVQRCLNQIESRYTREAAELAMTPVSNARAKADKAPILKHEDEVFFGGPRGIVGTGKR